MRVIFEVTDSIDFISCRIYFSTLAFSGKNTPVLTLLVTSTHQILVGSLLLFTPIFPYVLPIFFFRSLSLSLFLLLIVPSLSLRLFPSVSLLPLSGSLSLFSSVLLSLLLLFLSSFSFLTQCSLSTIIAPQGSWFPHTVQFSNPTSFICF